MCKFNRLHIFLFGTETRLKFLGYTDVLGDHFTSSISTSNEMIAVLMVASDKIKGMLGKRNNLQLSGIKNVRKKIGKSEEKINNSISIDEENVIKLHERDVMGSNWVSSVRRFSDSDRQLWNIPMMNMWFPNVIIVS